MWARFTERFLFDRRPRQAIAFDVPPGTHNKPRDVVEAAIAAGKAKTASPPKRRPKTSNTPAA